MALKFDRWPWKKNRAPLQQYIKLCASFQIHWWNQTGVTVWKRSIRVKICDFLSLVTLKFDGWLWEIIGHLFYVASSFVYHFKAISVFNLSYSPEMLNSGQNQRFFVPCDLEIWWMTLKSHRAPLLCYFKLCASFHSHQRNQAGVTVRKCSIRVKICDIFVLCDLEIRWMTLKNNREPLLYYVKLCASFQSHQWIQTWVTVQKHSIRVKIRVFCPVWPRNSMDDLEKQ